MVDDRLQRGDGGEEADAGPDSVLHADHRPEGTKEKIVGADIDGTEHGDETEQVEPGGEPADEAVPEDRSPVIEAASRRIGRADLRHGYGEDAGDRAANRPANTNRRAAGARGRLRQRI